MDNSFFVLSKQNVEVSRLHICTWDVTGKNSFVEIGIEFEFPENIDSIELKFIAPFVKKEDRITCLLDRLCLREHSKFIFNDIIMSSSPIEEDDKNGTILKFKTREKLAILPLRNDIEAERDGVISFRLRKPKIADQLKFYVRFLIDTAFKTLSNKKNGIAKTSFVYDIKLNENRNIPDNVVDFLKDYKLCTIRSCFCFHVIPNSFSITFVDPNKMKNIRMLEVEAFKRYLPKQLGSMKEGKYMIVFNKSGNASNKSGNHDVTPHSFFTIFEKETIGTKQVLFAIAANLICSLLFGISAWRTSFINPSIVFWKQIPIEYYIAISIFIALIILFVLSTRKK